VPIRRVLLLALFVLGLHVSGLLSKLGILIGAFAVLTSVVLRLAALLVFTGLGLHFLLRYFFRMSSYVP